MFYRCFLFFFVFFPSTTKTRQPFSGTAERIFMKLLPNDRGEMEFPTLYPNFCCRLPNDSEKLIYAGLLAMALCSYGGHCALGGDPWRMTEKRLC